MTVFYDPKKRKPKMGVVLLLMLIPLLLVLLVFVIGNNKVEQEVAPTKVPDDVFDKF